MLTFNDDGTATITEHGRTYAFAVTDCTHAHQPDGTTQTALVRTPELTAADGMTLQACFTVLGAADGQRLVARMLHANGADATLADAGQAVAAQIRAAGGVVRLDPDAP